MSRNGLLASSRCAGLRVSKRGRGANTTYTSARNFSYSAPRQQPRLVVLGSGWGGYEVIRGLNKKRWDITVVSPTNYFNFTPLLASCAVGTLEFRTAVESVRRYSPDVRAYTAWCDSIDFNRKVLKCMPATPLPAHKNGRPANPIDGSKATTSTDGSDAFEIPYDRLVIAVGAYSQTFNTPGVKEHAHFLKDVKDARAIRTRVLECFEQANQPILTDDERRKLLHFCIVGGGPTGVEFAAELHDLLHTDIRRHYPDLAKLSRISLFDVAPNILGSFDEGLQEYATKKFSREGIRIWTEHHVERVEEGKLFVKEKGEIPFGLLVWSTGLAPNPLVQSITEVEKDPRTQSLITDEHLNVKMKDTGKPNPDVYAIGDAAMIQEVPLPATAQVAYQKARYMSKKLNALMKDKDHTAPFQFHNMGSLAYLGDWVAVYDRTKVESGPKTKEAGRVAWLLWRSAYFTRTFSIRNKILVPMYWFINWIFGRDLTRF
ncbi:FAD/NAD-P-binding domain-containing protein [Panus rudis PR-1116 ss-1]|nr:FAD/NAD-P-binding domain-containing protein [Panus rudis PR-1116 ss-1]